MFEMKAKYGEETDIYRERNIREEAGAKEREGERAREFFWRSPAVKGNLSVPRFVCKLRFTGVLSTTFALTVTLLLSSSRSAKGSRERERERQCAMTLRCCCCCCRLRDPSRCIASSTSSDLQRNCSAPWRYLPSSLSDLKRAFL